MCRDFQTYVLFPLIIAIGMRTIALNLLHSMYMFSNNLSQLKFYKQQHIFVLSGNNNQTAYLSGALKCLH